MRSDSPQGIDLYIEHLEAKAAGRWSVAKRLLMSSADFGEPMALHALAYDQARPEEALRLYMKAADAGYAPSAWNLYLHHSDIGDQEAAAGWLQRAAELGDEDAVTATSRASSANGPGAGS